MGANEETRVLMGDRTAGKWLNTIVNPGTKALYIMALKNYLQFTGKTPAELIEEAVEDMKKDPREQQDVVLARLVKFYEWLKKDYKGKRIKKPLSDSAVDTQVTAVRSFYAAYKITVRLKGRTALPKARRQNKRLIVNAEQVKQLLNYAPNIRDRAIMLTLFQSGIDVSTLCSLKYGDVASGLQSGELPLTLDLYREKTGIEFQTFIGKSAVEAIRTYIKDREARGYRFEDGSPLFQKEAQMNGKSPAMEPDLVQIMMKSVAAKAGFVKPSGYNILGPHALRESFGSIMINAGVPDSVVDFWLGHAIGDMAKAYKQTQHEAIRKMYAERERLIDPYVGIGGNGAELGKVKAELEEKSKILNEGIATLALKNADLENRITAMIAENQTTKNTMHATTLKNTELERRVVGLESLLGKITKDLEDISALVRKRKEQIQG